MVRIKREKKMTPTNSDDPEIYKIDAQGRWYLHPEEYYIEVQQGLERMTVVRAYIGGVACCWRLESPKEARAFIDDVIGEVDVSICGHVFMRSAVGWLDRIGGKEMPDDED